MSKRAFRKIDSKFNSMSDLRCDVVCSGDCILRNKEGMKEYLDIVLVLNFGKHPVSWQKGSWPVTRTVLGDLYLVKD